MAHFVHVRANLVLLGERMEAKAILSCSRDMEEGQRLTACIEQLSREQLALKNDASTATLDADKNHQFMTQTWSRNNVFGSKVMKQWMKKSPASQAWAHSVPHFKKENAAREQLEQARGQERPADGASALSNLEARVEAKVEARHECMFQSQSNQFALIVKECKKLSSAPSTHRCTAAQVSDADTSNDKSEESNGNADNESVVEAKTNHNHRTAIEMVAACM